MTRVQVEQGDVEGVQDGGVYRFLGLPFAAPPVGDLRWRPPEPALPWSGVRDATHFGDAAIQTVDTGLGLRAEQSEDCLHLNVWTTTTDPGARRPVMVWIHGGGNMWGAGSLPECDGAALARRDVTVVTVNYRLGAFGFLADPDAGANAAVGDWVAALTWVARNIAGFGGDPGNVTVFGQSAGAVAVRTLLSTPSARGLFHRVIIQSGGFEPYAFVPAPSYARTAEASAAVLDQLGCANVEAARQVPADQVRKASLIHSGAAPTPGRVHTPANLAWYPVPDGDVVVDGLPDWAAEVPVLLGCVEDEARYFVRPDADVSRETLEHLVTELAGPRGGEVLAHLDDAGRSPYEALAETFSAAIWHEPAAATLDRFTALGRSVYYYRFARSSPGARRTGTLASHASEIPYVFGNFDPADDYDAIDHAVSEAMQTAWAEFARTGVPRSPDGNPWPRYDPSSRRYSHLGDQLRSSALAPDALVDILRSLRTSAR